MKRVEQKKLNGKQLTPDIPPRSKTLSERKSRIISLRSDRDVARLLCIWIHIALRSLKPLILSNIFRNSLLPRHLLKRLCHPPQRSRIRGKRDAFPNRSRGVIKRPTDVLSVGGELGEGDEAVSNGSCEDVGVIWEDKRTKEDREHFCVDYAVEDRPFN